MRTMAAACGLAVLVSGCGAGALAYEHARVCGKAELLDDVHETECVALSRVAVPFLPCDPVSWHQTTLQGAEVHRGAFLLAATGTCSISPSNGDIEDYSGCLQQYGAGWWLGGGVRLMDFTFTRKNVSGTYSAEAQLGYVGIGGVDFVSRGESASGLGRRWWGWNMHVGLGLGVVHVEGPGIDDWDFASAFVVGIYAYGNVTPRGPAIGVVAEIGGFWAEPASIDIGGFSTLIGAYVYF